MCWTRGPRAGPASRPTGTEWQVATTRTAGPPAEASRCPLEEEEKRGEHKQRASSTRSSLRALMYQGGDAALQAACGRIETCSVHQPTWGNGNLSRCQRGAPCSIHGVGTTSFRSSIKAEHRALNAEVAGSYPVDSLQSAMPQRSGAPLRMECNSQAGSTPVVDTSSHGVTVTQEVLIL